MFASTVEWPVTPGRLHPWMLLGALALSFLHPYSVACAQEALTDLSPLVAPILAKHDIPGMAVAVVTSDGPLGYGFGGVRRRGAKSPIKLDDKFHVGSCTKSMTATLCAILVEKRGLKWELTLQEAFPKLAKTGKLHSGFRPVTLEQLLCNQGSFPHALDRDGLWGKLRQYDGRARLSRQMLLEGVVVHAPEQPPGSKWVYSNAGFAVAGHIAETLQKRDYETLIAQMLFAPLGMNSAGFGPPKKGKTKSSAQPYGHGLDGKPVPPGITAADNPVAVAPAGRAHMSIPDWGKYISFHLGGSMKGSELLSRESFTRLHRPYENSTYAMGWSTGNRGWAGKKAGAGGPILTHSGSNTMWYCVTWLAPERDFAVLIACNQGGDRAAKACDDAAGALIRRFPH